MRLDLIATTLLLAATATPAAAQQEFRWHGRIAAGKSIEIKGVNGDVSAVAGSGETEVTAVKRAKRSDPDDVKIEVVEHADGVTICAVYPSDGRRENSCAPGEGGHMNTRDNDVGVYFTVRVPAGVKFIGKTVNGEMEAANLASDVDAVTVNGDIVSDFPLTVTGRLGPRRVHGTIGSGGRELSLTTVNGSIKLRKGS